MYQNQIDGIMETARKKKLVVQVASTSEGYYNENTLNKILKKLIINSMI